MTYSEQAAALPTVAVTRFVVLASPTMVRLAFGEQVRDDKPPVFHYAIALTASDARWLANLIEEQLLKAEKGST